MADLLVLGIGSNCGDCFANIKRSIIELPVSALSVSSFYKSKPLLPKNAPKNWNMPYLNTVVLCYTDHSPFNLLSIIKEIERNLGRIAKQKWSPRPIDIDILLWENNLTESTTLTIPHVALLERDFVLVPMVEVCPGLIHPRINQNIQSIIMNASFEIHLIKL